MAAKRDGGKNTPTLRDHRAALEAAETGLPAVAVIAGECEYLRAEAAGRYRDAWLGRYPNGDVVILRGAGESRPLTYGDMVREMAGGSLFAREKLLIVRQAERLLFPGRGAAAGQEADGQGEAGAGPAGEKAFIDFLAAPPSGIWLLVETAQLPGNRTMAKKLAAAGTVIPCPEPTLRDVPAWLDAKAKERGKLLGGEAAEMLAVTHGADLGILAREVEKLALFAGERDTIDAAMVGEFLTGTIEFEVFGFTNAIEERNLGKAMLFARRIAVQGARDQRGKRESGEQSAHRVLGLLTNTVQGLFRAGVALAERKNRSDFAASAGLSPWRAEKLMDAAGRFELRELRAMVRFAADQVRRAHDTGGDAALSLEVMAARFASPSKARAKRAERSWGD